MADRKIVRMGTQVALAVMIEEDQSSFHQWQQNQELRKLIDDARIPTSEDQQKWFARSKEPDRKMFSLITLPEEQLIGHGGFVDIVKEAAQFRITIGDPDAWGKGYGTEATRLILRYGFEQLGFEKIWLRVRKNNDRAVRSYQKVGFQEEDPEERNPAILRMTISSKQLFQ